MKTFKEIETELSSLKSTNLTDIEKYQGNIVKANQALKIANEKLATAEETADLEAYNKAKEDIWTSQHAIELYQSSWINWKIHH